MAKEVDRVCEKYEIKLGLGQMPSRVDQDQERQVMKYRAAAAKSEELRKAVAATLGRLGVASIWWPYYYDFVRTLAGHRNQGLPEAIKRAEAKVRVDLWVSRGLVREVLEAISCECLNLDLREPPVAEPPKPV